MSGLFITSTGTSIGKTYVTRLLLATDRQRHQKLTGSKPIISDWPSINEEIQHTDSGLILKALGRSYTPEAINQISPWRYSAPLTPSMAAIEEGKVIDVNALITFSRNQIQRAQSNNQIHVIEGAGGVMSPIWETFTNREWILSLNCPCVLVVGSYLGTLSHTLTAIEALNQKNIPIMAVVFNEFNENSVFAEKTRETLATLISPIPLILLANMATHLDELYCVTLETFSNKMCSIES